MESGVILTDDLGSGAINKEVREYSQGSPAYVYANGS